MITNGLIGLVLLLGSVALLNTINPDVLNLEAIKPIEIVVEEVTGDFLPGGGGGTGSLPWCFTEADGGVQCFDEQSQCISAQTSCHSDSACGPVPDDGQCSQGDIVSLAQRMLNNPDINYWITSSGNTRAVVEALANGDEAPVTCGNAGRDSTTVDPNLLAFILAYYDQASPVPNTLNAITDKCHSSGSKHYIGKAVDFGCPFNRTLGDALAAQYGYRRYSGEWCNGDQPGDGNNHYHYESL